MVLLYAHSWPSTDTLILKNTKDNLIKYVLIICWIIKYSQSMLAERWKLCNSRAMCIWSIKINIGTLLQVCLSINNTCPRHNNMGWPTYSVVLTNIIRIYNEYWQPILYCWVLFNPPHTIPTSTSPVSEDALSIWTYWRRPFR